MSQVTRRTFPAFTDLMCEALVGGRPDWSDTHGQPQELDFCRAADMQGVLGLIHAKADTLPWPASVKTQLRRLAAGRALWEHEHQELLANAIQSLERKGIPTFVYKGTALAYTIYPAPHLRARTDSDVMVPSDARHEAIRVLRSLGWTHQGTTEPKYLAYETSAVIRRNALQHSVDLHWRIHYSQLQARRLPFEELWSDAQSIDGLCRGARGPSTVYALLIACMHRANELHVPQWNDGKLAYGADRLIWLYDVHLLIQRLDAADFDRFISLATAKGMASTCLEMMLLTQQLFGTPIPPAAIQALASSPAFDELAHYHAASAWKRKWLDFAALPNAAARALYLKEHLLPGDDYLRANYSSQGSLFARRIKRIYRRAQALGTH